MYLTEIYSDHIAWEEFLLFLEDLSQIQMHGNRRKSLEKAAKERSNSPIAQILDKWFPDGKDRIVIPITSDEEDSSRLDAVNQALLNVVGGFEAFGFIATPEYTKNNLVYDEDNHRPIKFSNAIELIRNGRQVRSGYQKINWIDSSNNKEVADYLERHTKRYTDEASYINSSKTTGERYVIVSKHPADIVTMSTGRPWTSCMNLQGGEQARCLAPALTKGMIVAYLVIGSREEVDNLSNDVSQPVEAVARIAIKPLKKYLSQTEKMNGHPIGIGWPEDRIYHANRADLTGFRQTVVAWVKSKIRETLGGDPTGNYRVLGGYTDSLESFNSEIYFYNADNVRKALTKAVLWSGSYGHPEYGAIQSILRHTPNEVSDEIVALAFRVLIKRQPHSKDVNTYTGHKAPRYHLDPSERDMIAMLRKFPKFLPDVQQYLSPVLSNWIVGGSSGAAYEYIQRLASDIINNLTPQLSPYIQSTIDNLRHIPNFKMDRDEVLRKYGKIPENGPQMAQRSLSRLKVAIRSFIKEQNIYLPDGTVNMIKDALQLADGFGLNTSAVRELLPGFSNESISS